MKKQRKTNKSFSRRIWLALSFVFAFSLMFGGLSKIVFAQTAPDPIFSYQGRVLNSSGVPVSDSALDMKFEVYTAASGGSCVWSNSSTNCDGDTPAMTSARSVTLTDGLFSEALGDTAASTPYAAFDEGIFSTDASLYLQVYIDGETLSPRKLLTATPFATNASYLDGYNSTEIMLLTDGGATTYLAATTDDFAIGGSSPTASPFGIDESANTIYIGEGSNSDGSIVFKASDADTGTLAYTTDDLFDFSGGDINVSGLTSWKPTPGSTTGMIYSSGTISSSASGGAGIYDFVGINSELTNTSAEGIGYDQGMIALNGSATNATSGELANLYGVYGSALNGSTSANAIGVRVVGVYGDASNSGAITVPAAFGLMGQVRANAGTITEAYGLYAEVNLGAGSITTSYAGDFVNTSEGTTRYGIRAGASGGTTNYSGYFYGAPLYVGSTTTPPTGILVDGAGDLYVYDQLEISGANQTANPIIKVDTGNQTTGSALYVRRADSGTDFTGAQGFVNFSIDDTNSNGHLLYLNHDGTGKSLYIDQVGDDTALDVRGTSTSDYLATFFNDGNSDANMGISIQACIDANPTTACNYLLFKDGDGNVLGAVEGDGAGGVTNASAGSDYAELFSGVYSDFSAGDIIALDSSGSVILAQNAAEIIGAFSVAPNTLGNWIDGWQNTGSYVPVALLGQVPVNVNDSGGAISAGDYVTLSSSAGVGRRATGAGYVLGIALEPLASSSGTIEVLVNPGWAAVGMLAEDGTALAVNANIELIAQGTATATLNGVDSNEFILRGSGWNGSVAEDLDMILVGSVSDASDYGLAIKNDDGSQVAYISSEGDLSIAGRLYPSDRGTLQTDKYIYYDGSSGAGGDFMRTNASGWGAGSYDFAEMFPSQQALAAGEVVVFAKDEEHVERSTGKKYDDQIAGVVSTQPGFLAGENKEGYVPIALAGRVPTYVSGENGDIAVGDPLTSSSKAGYAMKATEAGPIVGYAMETFSGNTGAITVFIRPSYYDGGSVSDAPATNNTTSGIISVSGLNLSGATNLGGGSLTSIGSLIGLSNNWTITEDGKFSTRGQYVELIESYQGDLVETYASLSRESTIELSGTAELEDGIATIKFEEVDPYFNDVISNEHPYKVFLTADGPTNALYAVNRTTEGFRIRESDGTSNANVDWMVIAYHKDYAPEIIPKEDNVTEVQEADSEVGDQPQIEEDITESTQDTDSETSQESVLEQPVSTDTVVEDEQVLTESTETIVEERAEQTDPTLTENETSLTTQGDEGAGIVVE